MIVDLKASNAISSQKTSPSFVDLYVGNAKFGKCCDVGILGHMCKYITLWQKSNYYFLSLYTSIANVGKNKHILVTNDNYMVHKTYG